MYRYRMADTNKWTTIRKPRKNKVIQQTTKKTNA